MEDSELDSLRIARKAAELGTYLLFVVKFDLLSVDDYFQNAAARWVTLFFLSTGTLVLSFLVVLAVVRSELRRSAAASMALPFGAMAVAVTPFLLMWASVSLLSLNRLDSWFPWVVAALLNLLFLVVYLVLFLATLVSLFVSAHTYFFAGLAHPILPPLLTVATVWILTAFDVGGVQDRVVTAVFDDVDRPHSTLSTVLGIVTAVVATTFAVLEIRLLHARGHHLRTGPWT